MQCSRAEPYGSLALPQSSRHKVYVKIRPYQKTDFEKLYEIDHQAFSERIAYSYIELQYYVRSRKCRTLIAEDDDVIVGFVIGCSEPSDLGHIITIDVVPGRQRQHIGSLMLAEIESWLWERGAKAIYLETPVDDTGAQGFYDKHGYFVIERVPRYYHKSLDGLVMMKTSKRSEIHK
jgi:ribosomal protein S18 acetylase RimI-like enzyme